MKITAGKKWIKLICIKKRIKEKNEKNVFHKKEKIVKKGRKIDRKRNKQTKEEK